jgi:hypothetical protein
MASGHTGNVVPGNRLRVRLPCPPLHARTAILASASSFEGPAVRAGDWAGRCILASASGFEGPAVQAGGVVVGTASLVGS